MLKLLGTLMIIATCSWVFADKSECVGKCPVYSSIDASVSFLPHKNCNMYCVCDHGKPVEMPCPSDLHWATKWNSCVDPTIAECAGYNPESVMYSLHTEEENY